MMVKLEVWASVTCMVKFLQSKLIKRKQYSFFHITMDEGGGIYREFENWKKELISVTVQNQ